MIIMEQAIKSRFFLCSLNLSDTYSSTNTFILLKASSGMHLLQRVSHSCFEYFLKICRAHLVVSLIERAHGAARLFQNNKLCN